jgi:hypothetical protein
MTLTPSKASKQASRKHLPVYPRKSMAHASHAAAQPTPPCILTISILAIVPGLWVSLLFKKGKNGESEGVVVRAMVFLSKKDRDLREKSSQLTLEAGTPR